MSKKHLIFIINPKSGVERNKVIEHTIDKKLDLNKFTYEIVHTQYAQHATALAREAAEKRAHAVVAVGGDGSANDIVTGLWGTDTALAIIPKGSGNGLARSLGIPLDAEKAIEVINRDKSLMIDVGFANGRPFVCNAGVAFDALIAEKFAKSNRRGLAIYSWLVTRLLWTYKEREWHINIDGDELTKRAFIISIVNVKQYGYNFKIAPDASCTDGLFDIIIIKKIPKILGAGLVLRALNGTITKSKYVQHYIGKEVVLSHPDLCKMQADGDSHSCQSSIHFHLEKGLQKVLIP